MLTELFVLLQDWCVHANLGSEVHTRGKCDMFTYINGSPRILKSHGAMRSSGWFARLLNLVIKSKLCFINVLLCSMLILIG